MLSLVELVYSFKLILFKGTVGFRYLGLEFSTNFDRFHLCRSGRIRTHKFTYCDQITCAFFAPMSQKISYLLRVAILFNELNPKANNYH